MEDIISRHDAIDEILCAIEQYTDANIPIPKSWVNELRDLLKSNLWKSLQQ